MARSRLLKIGLYENEDMATLPDKARLLYPGLWLLADRCGRLEDRPVRIRAQLFPYEPEINADALLDALAAKPGTFIVRYQVDGVRYIWIPKFLVHQSPHIREAESKIPRFSESPGSALQPPGLSPGSALAEHSPGSPVSVSVLDPVTVRVSDQVSDPVSVSESVNGYARRGRAQERRAHNEDEALTIARSALQPFRRIKNPDQDEIVDAVQNAFTMKHRTLRRADALLIITRVLSERRTA